MDSYQQLCVDFFTLIGSVGPTLTPAQDVLVVAVIEDIAALAPPPPPTSVPAVRPGGAAIPAAKH